MPALFPPQGLCPGCVLCLGYLFLPRLNLLPSFTDSLNVTPRWKPSLTPGEVTSTSEPYLIAPSRAFIVQLLLVGPMERSLFLTKRQAP